MYRRHLLFILVVFISCSLHGQKQDYVWVLGAGNERTVVDFNHGMKMERPISESNPFIIGSDVTSISTFDGELLFYANGCNFFHISVC